jgi:SAM-dependent methyltransferase
VLEIGCGNGFFLKVALAQGYAEVHGVEPSAQAISQAAERVRPQIVCDVLRPGLFEAGTFDVICIFQVFDHISDPGALLDECLRLLKPGGFLLAYNHNVEALSARLLGERSPIIDIEHTYLYSPKTMRRIVEQHGFAAREIGAGANRYRLSYLMHLVPLPRALKKAAVSFMQGTPLGKIPLSVRLGNLYLIAGK